jgi:hypothetical protein
MEQNHLFTIDHNLEHPMRPDFDFPKLAFDLAELDANRSQSPPLYLVERFENTRTLRFGETVDVIQHRTPAGGRCEKRYSHEYSITDWLYRSNSNPLWLVMP